MPQAGEQSCRRVGFEPISLLEGGPAAGTPQHASHELPSTASLPHHTPANLRPARAPAVGSATRDLAAQTPRQPASFSWAPSRGRLAHAAAPSPPAGCLPAPGAAPPRTVWPRPASLRRRVQLACRRQTSSACWTAMTTSRSRSSRWAAQEMGGQSRRAKVLAQPRASVCLPLPPPSPPTASSSLPPFARSSHRAVEGRGRRSRQPQAYRGASSSRSSSDDLQQPRAGAAAAAT